MAVQILERNRFFFGKLMDVAQFEKEQTYFRRQSALLNRLVIGRGVVCGLGVAADPDHAGNVIVSPGVAIDGMGRLIVVPEAVSIDPVQPTDQQGKPQGPPLQSGEAIVCLAFAESCADPVAVFINDCDNPGDCAASTIREGFYLLVSAASGPPPPPPACPLPNFPGESPADLQADLAKLISGACADPSADCIPLARLDVLKLTIDAASDRPLVYGNSLLWQLMQCLPTGAPQARILKYVSGDNQSAPAGQTLPAPLVVQVVDQQNHPVSGIGVDFAAVGGGSPQPALVITDAQGNASTSWKLGNTGVQHMTAFAAGSPMQVLFQATAL